eukprot:evm.model.NODE_9615_length_1589_cov_13.481435.1
MWEKHQIPLDSNAYTCILTSFAVGGEWKQALLLMDTLEKKDDEDEGGKEGGQ